MRRFYLMVVWEDVEPQVCGPFKSEKARDERAKEIRAGDPDKEHGIYMLDIDSAEEPEQVEADAYSNGFFMEDADDED